MRRLVPASIFLAVVAVCVGACGDSDGGGSDDDDGVPDYLTTPAAGKFAGADWTHAAGLVKPATIAGATQAMGSYELYSSAVDGGCAAFAPVPSDNKALLFTASLAAIELALSSTQTATFYDNSTGENKNLVALEGKLAIDEVAVAAVKGRLVAVFDDANTINGTFTVTRCCLAANGFSYETCTE